MSKAIDLIQMMEKYDVSVEQMNEMRNGLIAKLYPEIMKMDLSVTKATDADMYASQTKAIAELRGLLSDVEGSYNRSVNTKVKLKEVENTANIAFSAAEFLSKIKLTDKDNTPGSPCLQSKEEVDALIEKQFEDSGSVILDSELEDSRIQLPSHNEDEIY